MMEPRTTGPGQKQLESETSAVRLTYKPSDSGARSSHVRSQSLALMPKSGGELVSEFTPGIGGALMAGGFVLCVIAAAMKRRKR